ncbi:MAG: DUF2059 domain-containing protein [Candidatus Sedimenticola sp. (ex Thyasira tokunagai)]
MKNVVLILILLMNSAFIYAGEYEDKIAAAKRYASATPMKDMIADSANKMAVQLPQEQRQNFILLLTQTVDIEVLEKTALDAMVKTFTLEELNAIADFYGSQVGKSVMSKFGTYMSLIMPSIIKEMQRASKVVESEIR